MTARSLCLPLLAVLLASCATVPKHTFTNPSVDTAFLWRATQAGQPGTLYLLGTLHLRADGKARLDASVTDALAESQVLALELEPDAQSPAEMKLLIDELAVMKDATTADLLEPAQLEALNALGGTCGMPNMGAAPFEPWFAGMVLAVTCAQTWGYGGASVEQLLARRGKARDVPIQIVELETARGQLEAAGVSERDPAGLVASLDLLTREVIAELVGKYEAHDVAGLTAMLVEMNDAAGTSQEELDAMWADRNQGMADKGRAFLAESQTTLLAVGAGHMAGEGGVLSLLAAEGVQIEPVPSKGLGEALAPDPADLEPVQGLGFVADFGGPAEMGRQEVPVAAGVVALLSTWTARPLPGGELLVSAIEFPAELAAAVTFPAGVEAGVSNALATMTDAEVPLQEIEVAGQPAFAGTVEQDGLWAQLIGFVWGGRLYQVMGVAQTTDSGQKAELQERFAKLVQTLQLTD